MIKKFFSTLTALALFMGVSASVLADDTATATTGTLTVSQTGALGTVAIVGPSAASVTTATYTNASAAVGSYTVTVTAPTGFVVDKIKDGAGVVLATPFTQALVAGATITYAVSYVAAPATPSTPVEITQQMIKDKTALCAAMKGGKAKLACMKERNQMKRDFQKQEKAKREAARKLDSDKDGVPDIKDAFPTDPKEWKDSDKDGTGDNAERAARNLDTDKDGVPDIRDAFPTDPKEWKDGDKDGIGDNAEKAVKDAAKAAIDAKVVECGKLATGTDKDKCLADLAVLKKSFADTYGKKHEEQNDSNFGQKKEDKEGDNHGNGKGNN